MLWLLCRSPGQKEMQVSICPQRDFSTKWGKRTYEDQHLSSERLVRVAQTCCAPCIRFGFPSRLFCFGCFVAILSWSPPSGTKGNEGHYLSTELLFAWAALSHSVTSDRFTRWGSSNFVWLKHFRMAHAFSHGSNIFLWPKLFINVS